MRLWLLLLACCGLALAAPAGAGAATVVNGSFEAGSLEGWQVATPDHEFGDWFAYQGTTPPFSLRGKNRGTVPVPAPPQGEFAAVADELDPIAVFLYQDVTLAPGLRHQLSLRAFYSSNKPLAAPIPDSLSPEESAIGSQANQQFRIDVMRPEAPLESIDPADVLRTVFQTTPGDPQKMPPSRLSANLTPFAGQTVRLRVAVVAGREALNGGIDDVSIASAPAGAEVAPGGTGPGGKGSKRTAALRVIAAKSLANGRALLRVHVPSPGRLTAKCPKRLVPASAQAAAARTVTLRLKPTATAMRALKRKRSLHLRAALAFRPRAEAPLHATAPVTLKLAPRRRP